MVHVRKKRGGRRGGTGFAAGATVTPEVEDYSVFAMVISFLCATAAFR